MKQILAILLMFVSLTGFSQADFFKKADAFFKANVNDQGGVAYDNVKADRSDLNELVSLIANADFDSYDAQTQKAFMINTYNIWVIEQVVDLLPIKSPLDNPKFFNGIEHTMAGKSYTLDGLEKGKLYVEYPDSRLHFALVCAAKSCPPLANYGWYPEGLEDKLETRTKEVLNLDWFIQVGKKVSASQIFSWYKKDFEKDGKLIDYIAKYREGVAGKKVTFYEYDWTLNQQ
ncbi:MAG: DUF547 domain-containing protein [Cytophagales bacterium]|nr:DUF547 domain-containing protein [Cytophagales bacterium]